MNQKSSTKSTINHQPQPSNIKHQASITNHQPPNISQSSGVNHRTSTIKTKAPNIKHQSPNIDQSSGINHQSPTIRGQPIIRHKPPITINHRTCSYRIRWPRRCRRTGTTRRTTAGPGPDVPGRPPESGSAGSPECHSTGTTRNNVEFRGPRCRVRAVRRRGSVTPEQNLQTDRMHQDLLK